MRNVYFFVALGLWLTPIPVRAQEDAGEADANLRIETPRLNYNIDFKELDENIRQYRQAEAAIQRMNRMTEERREQERRFQESVTFLRQRATPHRETDERELFFLVPILALKLLGWAAFAVALLIKIIRAPFQRSPVHAVGVKPESKE